MTYFTDNSSTEALFFRHRAAPAPGGSTAMARGYWSRYSELLARKLQGASVAREGEATLVDLAFIADRRAIIQSRREAG